MRDVAADLAAVLAAAGLDLTTGTNLWIGQLPPERDPHGPDKAVAILQTGGNRPQSFVGQKQKALLAPSCQVRVRGNREDPAGSHSLALACFAALNQIAPAPYISIRATESSPFFVGMDSADRPQWTFTVECQYLEIGGTVPALVLSPSGTVQATNVTVAPIAGLAADDAQDAFAEHQADIDAEVAARTAADDAINAQLVPATTTAQGFVSTLAQSFAGLKTLVAGLALQAKLTITGVASGERAIEIPAGSRLSLNGSDVGALTRADLYFDAALYQLAMTRGLRIATGGAGSDGLYVAAGPSSAQNAIHGQGPAGGNAFVATQDGVGQTYHVRTNGLIRQRGTDSSGTAGAATIDKVSGISSIAGGATSVVITNSIATAASRIMLTWYGDLGTQSKVPWVSRAAGSFTVNVGTAPAGAVAFGWEINELM